MERLTRAPSRHEGVLKWLNRLSFARPSCISFPTESDGKPGKLAMAEEDSEAGG